MESQNRSVEARSSCEPGEERLIETSLPLGDNRQKLPSCFQRRMTLRTTRFVRIDGPVATMAR